MILLVLGLLGSSLLARRAQLNRRHARAGALWQQFAVAVKQLDRERAETSLQQLVDLTGDERAARYLAAVRAGEADASDPALAGLLMNDHLRHGRRDEATREAEKRLSAVPHDWQARCLVADRARRAGRSEEAIAHLAALPSPHDDSASATPGSLLFALRLNRDLGRDDSEIISFLTARVVPLLKSARVGAFPAGEQLQMLECYRESLTLLERKPELAELFVPAVRLAGRLDGEATFSTEQRAGLGFVWEALLAEVRRLEQMGRLPAADAAVLEAELEENVRVHWERLRAAAPADATAYVGLALAAYRQRQPDQAVRLLQDGLSACGDRPEFFRILGGLLRQRDPRQALAWLEEARARWPNDLNLLEQYAETAWAARRPDLALAACEAAQQRKADLPWACRLAAAAQLAAGRPTAAIEALSPLRTALAGDAGGAELYVRALCAVGADHLAETFLQAIPPDGLPSGGLGGARGLLAQGRHEAAARWAQRVVDRAPDQVPARRILAEALRLLAEAGDAPAWDTERVRAALRAYEWLQSRDPEDLAVVQRIVWLQLKGLRLPDLAYRTAAPLRAAAALDLAARETLAAVYLGVGQPREAVPLLDPAIAAEPDRTGLYVLRAQAH
ncbi:MAG: tetratricopeptide repeat protein, partial [Gemmataceae bacterium]